MRVVLDTNVLIAAFATRGLCEDVLRAALAEHELIVSEFILAELERVLLAADWPEKDPEDRWIVATALTGEAEVLVSGDRDLLDASHESRVDVISLREFWERLR